MNPPVPPHVASVETFFVAVGVAAVEVRVLVTSVEAFVVVESVELIRVDDERGVEVETRVDEELDTMGAALNVLKEVICQKAF